MYRVLVASSSYQGANAVPVLTSRPIMTTLFQHRYDPKTNETYSCARTVSITGSGEDMSNISTTLALYVNLAIFMLGSALSTIMLQLMSIYSISFTGDGEKDKKAFRRWWKYNRFVLFFAVLALLFGVQRTLYAMSSLMQIKFPNSCECVQAQF